MSSLAGSHHLGLHFFFFDALFPRLYGMQKIEEKLGKLVIATFHERCNLKFAPETFPVGFLRYKLPVFQQVSGIIQVKYSASATTQEDVFAGFRQAVMRLSTRQMRVIVIL